MRFKSTVGPYIRKTFLEALVYGDFVEKDGKKVVDLFNQKTGTSPIQKEETFEIKYLSQDKPETIQYVQKLLVNNSCFFRKYEAGKDSPETRAILTLMSQSYRTTILYRNENKSATGLYSLVLSKGL